MKLEFSRQIFGKCSNIKFHENPSSGSRVVQCGWKDGRTDMAKVTVAFRNFADAPKNTNRSTDKYKINKRTSNCNDTPLDIILRFCLCITASHIVNPAPWLRR